MKNIIFIAPPAAGKGTQAQMLKEKYNLVHISTGDLLRDIVASGTELGNQISEIMNRGELVSDDIVLTLLKNKIDSLHDVDGIIFDGYPRTLKQAGMLEDLLKSFNQEITHVLYLEIDKDMAMKRALGRVTCGSCGAIFNIYSDKIEKEGFCNKCGEELEHRDDDNEETFIKRFDSYLEKTQPLMDYYKSKGLLHNVKCCELREDTFKQIEDVINKGQ